MIPTALEVGMAGMIVGSTFAGGAAGVAALGLRVSRRYWRSRALAAEQLAEMEALPRRFRKDLPEPEPAPDTDALSRYCVNAARQEAQRQHRKCPGGNSAPS